MKPCNRMPYFLFVVVILLFPLTGCTMAGQPSVGSDIRKGSANLPNKLLVLPVSVSINEISAGGVVQEDPTWSKQGESAMALAVNGFFTRRGTTSLQTLPELTDEEKELVHEHVLLYDVVASQAYIAANVPAYGWSHLADDFHYSLGNGLRFLKQKSGADAALIVIGYDSISTGGRKTMIAIAALAGVGMPLGSSKVLVGVVDLEDGDLLWFQHSFAQGNLDLRKPEDASTLFAKAMEGYGGK